MRRLTAVLPILCAFVCGHQLPYFLRVVENGAPIRTATDLSDWIVVPILGLAALEGAWRACKAPRPTSE